MDFILSDGGLGVTSETNDVGYLMQPKVTCGNFS